MIRRPLKPDPKHRALKQSGTANPRPQSVRDPAFLEGDFFDPHDLTQVKYEMLRRVRSEGQSVTKASATFGVSRPTFYKVQADFDRNGLVGLLPAKRGPPANRTRLHPRLPASSRRRSPAATMSTPRDSLNTSASALVSWCISAR